MKFGAYFLKSALKFGVSFVDFTLKFEPNLTRSFSLNLKA